MYKAFNPSEIRDWMGRWSRGAHRNGETSAQQAFFAGSKVRDMRGRLKRVFHGTADEFPAFSNDKLSSFPGSSMGHFFTQNPRVAGKYAFDRAGVKLGLSRGVREHVPFLTSGATTLPVYLNIQNPYHMKGSEWRRKWVGPILDNSGGYLSPDHPAWKDLTDRVRAFRQELESRGHDGIRIGRLNEEIGPRWVAFRPNQIKGIFNASPTLAEDFMKSLCPETIIFLKGIGLARQVTGRQAKRGVPLRKPYMGRSRLYANRTHGGYVKSRTAHILKDLGVGDVHVPTAIGNSASPRRRKRYPLLSFARTPEGVITDA